MTLKLNCDLCGGEGVKLLSLPDYPMNFHYLPSYSENSKYVSNYEIFHCNNCLHIQGVSSYQLNDIYNENYHHYDDAGFQKRQNFFVNRTISYCTEKKFNRVIEIGCNDLSLLKKLKESGGVSAKYWIGVDPSVQIDSEQLTDGILFINGYIQDVDIPHKDESLPDLIISDQVLEHIPNVLNVLKEFLNQIHCNSSFITCVPSVELLIRNFNYPSILHEHIHYFSESSLNNLFHELGDFNLKISEFNEDFWGFLFQIHTKDGSCKIIDKDYDLVKKFKNNFDIYQQMLYQTKEIIDSIEGTIYGFGASDITESFCYFLKYDLSKLDFILDETPRKENMFIPNIKPRIAKLASVPSVKNAAILITAPQASRAILKRLIELNPKKIISPLNVL
jgi:hypothetical protein